MAFNTWTSLFWMPILIEAAKHIDFDVLQAPPIKKLLQWQNVEYAKSQAEEAGFRNVQTKVIEWPVELSDADDFVTGLTPLLPGLTGVGADKAKLESVQSALRRVIVDRYGEGKPFTLPASSGCFVGIK